MGAREIILVVSQNMSNNKKADRNENDLIRMSSPARDYFNFGNSKVEVVYKDNSSTFGIFQAFAEDIRKLKNDGFTNEQLKQTGFVTEKTLRELYKGTGHILRSGAFIGIFKEKEKEKPVLNIYMGADPEFLLFDNNNSIIRANSLIPKEGLIGSDGAMVEIRPNPAQCPSTLVQNMLSIFKNAAQSSKIKDYIWKASIYYKDTQRDYPVGGHIHIGNPPNIKKVTSYQRESLFAVFNKIMDELLALPLIKLDGDELGRSRRSNCQMAMGNQGYGYFGEWRMCDGRLEHRTLSGLWLMHPVVAECVIGTAKAIGEAMHSVIEDNNYDTALFKHPDVSLSDHKVLYRPEFNDWESIGLTSIMKCTTSSSVMSTMLNQSKARNITKKFLSIWYNKMKELPTYHKYDKYINKLYEILLLPKDEVSKVGFDIKKNWLEKTNFPT